MPHSPIIVIGSHRSGTGMITSMLERLGLFVGKKKEENHEAVFFLELNSWLLRQAGGDWDCPEPFFCLLNNADIRTLMVERIRYLIGTVASVSFLGLADYLRYRGLANLDFPWGWKDPRNTYTLPLWLEVFPAAKVIHVCRHGVDVADSLRNRETRQLAASIATHQRLKQRPLRRWLYCRPHERPIRQHASVRCASLAGSFGLWEMYMEQARANINDLQERAMEIQFESFVADAYQGLKALARFCHLEAEDGSIKSAAGGFEPDRAYAYRRKHELQSFAEEVADRLAAQRY
jgi:hypothetical protein